MARQLLLILWSLVYPVVVLLAAPFWLLKMFRRDGWGSGLTERLGLYDRDPELEKSGAVYLHAVSVGEVLLALKLIEKWRTETGDHFLLVPTTATGMAVAKEKAPNYVRVIYAPLDFGFLIRRVMKRFDPSAVLTIESELWPQLITQTHRLGIPIGLINARLSPRSGRRLRKLRPLVSPFLKLLDHVGVPESADLVRWQALGVSEEATVLTGNIKFDPAGAALPTRRPEFADMLSPFGNAPIVIAVSTFAGEEVFLTEAIRAAGMTPVIVPRHAERRQEVAAALGGKVILRSQFRPPTADETFIIDSTGELRDWTAHAHIVVIGKSFPCAADSGGQNPTEAILAGVPVIAGPHMANFEPLVSELRDAGGIQIATTREELLQALKSIPPGQPENARQVLEKHTGALLRTVHLIS